VLITKDASELEVGDEVALALMPHRGIVERITHRAEGLVITLQAGAGQFRVSPDSQVVILAPSDDRYIP
jgi:hypothetical protein